MTVILHSDILYYDYTKYSEQNSTLYRGLNKFVKAGRIEWRLGHGLECRPDFVAVTSLLVSDFVLQPISCLSDVTLIVWS